MRAKQTALLSAPDSLSEHVVVTLSFSVCFFCSPKQVFFSDLARPFRPSSHSVSMSFK